MVEEDKKLFKKFLEGDNQALEKIVKKYEKNLKYFILKYVKDIDAAEDIYQSVMVYMLEKKEIYDDKYSLKTYLYTIAKSRALNYIKKQKRVYLESEDNLTMHEEERLLEDIILSNERKEKIVSIMKKMSIEYQEVLYLIIIEGLSYEETARIMEKTISQIKNLTYRARKKMKKLLIEEKMVQVKNNKIIKMLIWITIIIFISSGMVYASMKIHENLKNNVNLTPVFTKKMGNTDYNSIWVGTFNLAWNELMEQFVNRKIEFVDGNTELVNELNKKSFDKEQLSEEDYYIKVGKTTPELKEEIINDIKNKFDIDGSNLLKDINFQPITKEDFTIYTLMYKDFKFNNPFDRLSNGKFAKSKEEVKYFGINNASSEYLNSNVKILFFNSKNDFAVKLGTMWPDKEEIILYRTDESKSFNKYYEDVKEKSNNYKGRTEFSKNDEIKIPYIQADDTINYDELCGKEIKGTDALVLRTAMQNVKFSLNEKGGNMTSEAVIMGTYNSYPEGEVPMYFYFDDTFVLFMKEENKEKPYLSLKVDNIDILVKE